MADDVPDSGGAGDSKPAAGPQGQTNDGMSFGENNQFITGDGANRGGFHYHGSSASPAAQGGRGGDQIVTEDGARNFAYNHYGPGSSPAAQGGRGGDQIVTGDNAHNFAYNYYGPGASPAAPGNSGPQRPSGGPDVPPATQGGNAAAVPPPSGQMNFLGGNQRDFGYNYYGAGAAPAVQGGDVAAVPPPPGQMNFLGGEQRNFSHNYPPSGPNTSPGSVTAPQNPGASSSFGGRSDAANQAAPSAGTQSPHPAEDFGMRSMDGSVLGRFVDRVIDAAAMRGGPATINTIGYVSAADRSIAALRENTVGGAQHVPDERLVVNTLGGPQAPGPQGPATGRGR